MKKLISISNTLVIIASFAILAVMSIEVLSPQTIANPKTIIHFHFTVCIIFLFDYFSHLAAADRKWRYALRNILFLIVSIPFLSIIDWTHMHVSKEWEFIIRYIPFIRAIYGFAIVLGYFTYSKVTNLFYSYVITIISTAYFCSLLFFSAEKGVNPGVKTFFDSLWWAFMDLTTVGSDIQPVTTIGRILAVVLAALGMMLFPIFTAYITSRFASIYKKQDS